MDTQLQQLKDIHLPKAISSWPLAPGYFIGTILLLILLSYGVWLAYRNWRHFAALKFARKQLQGLQQLVKHNPDNINIAAEISTLLRRTALHYFPRQKIAALTGDEWLTFLLSSKPLDQNSVHLLLSAPYQKNQPQDLLPLFTLAEHGLAMMAKRKHKEN